MAERALNLELQHKIDETSEEFKAPQQKLKERISETHTEELIIALCGPVGTDIHHITSEIAAIVKEKFNYDVEIIRLSDFIKNIKKVVYTDNQYEYINRLINAGNELRKEKGNSVLAELAINEIAVKRELNKSSNGRFTHRTCYIIDSIKNKEELEIFRLIYSHIFYFIGVFSNLDIREKNLEGKGISRSDIYKLIDRDSGEELQSGQKVSDTFVEADFFLRVDKLTSASINHKVTRFLHLIFSSEIITPTSDETAMYQAFAAAGNSACLSRQVGASIIGVKGEIVSVGWNDVPKYGGGVYMSSSTDLLGTQDFRCINIRGGVCFNDNEKEVIRTHLINQLIDKGVVKKEDRERAVEIVKNSRIKELIEFSRAVHAEMHAIIIGSQKSGHDIVGGKLYCTTYPCHNCARHIVAAGIKDVYYIEPYRKSLALKLHDDSISENENDEDKKVRILMFDGVSPRRFLELFTMVANSRKADGQKRKVDKNKVFPKKTVSLQAIPILEKEIIKELQSKNLIEL